MGNEVNKLVASLNKKFGKVVLHPASKVPPVLKVRWDIPAVDYVTGGGCPINRIIEIYGPESSGKSWLSYLMAGKFQHFDWASRTPNISSINYRSKKIAASGENEAYDLMEVESYKVKKKGKEKARIKTVAIVDHEGSYDPTWGKKLGVNNDGLLHIRPDRGTQAIDVIESLLYNEEISLVIVDSIGSISSDAEIDNSMEKEQMGKNPSMWNKAMRKFTAAMNSNTERDVTLILINRAYDKVGFVLGNPETIGGGKGIRFAKSLSIRVDAFQNVKKDFGAGEVIAGKNVKIKNMKNKTSAPYLESSYYYAVHDDDYVKKNHTDVPEQLISIGLQYGIIARSGNKFSYGKKLLATGRETFKHKLVENADLMAELNEEVYAHILDPDLI